MADRRVHRDWTSGVVSLGGTRRGYRYFVQQLTQYNGHRLIGVNSIGSSVRSEPAERAKISYTAVREPTTRAREGCWLGQAQAPKTTGIGGDWPRRGVVHKWISNDRVAQYD